MVTKTRWGQGKAPESARPWQFTLTPVFLALVLLAGSLAAGADTFRPPAVPLVTHDPYFSVWSVSDHLADEMPRHWTLANNEMMGMARIDGETWRFMGAWPRGPWPDNAPAMEQKSVEVWPTRTVYTFEAAGVELVFTFTTPALPDDLEVLARPVTYLGWDVRAIDGKKHDVALYFDAAGDMTVHDDSQASEGARFDLAGHDVLRLGNRGQPVLKRSGDRVRIDWGYLYLVAPRQQAGETVIGSSLAVRTEFLATGALPGTDSFRGPHAHDQRSHRRDLPVLAARFELEDVGRAAQSRHLLVGYDDLFSLEYFRRPVRPWWNRDEKGVEAMLLAAIGDYEELAKRCRAFDQALVEDLEAVGGPEYARLAALSYRQAVAAHKLAADYDGTPLFFSKENASNGSIATVDVTYPSAPLFLLLSPPLLEAMLAPVVEYAMSPRWKFPFAPHDLGRYPHANGQRYGGGETSEENQMPVEESGNMLILAAALARASGNADFAEKYWDKLSEWAAYLLEKGMDPENQLSTDDFTGHLAHNANLSLKAIIALAAYSDLARQLGHGETAIEYRRHAEYMAVRWTGMADDGDHYRLAFDQPGTWSQKYNLVWDRILGLDLFSVYVARKELAWYLSVQNQYGLPLDNRSQFTKLDWIVWTATLSEDRDTFRRFIEPVYRFANETPDRYPLTDWYWTHDAKRRGFTARSVVGGVYMPMLADPAAWARWAARAGKLR